MSKIELEKKLKNMTSEERLRFLQFLAKKNESKVIQGTTDYNILYPLSYSQQQVWISQEISNNKTIYNLNTTWKIKGNLDVEKLERCINIIIKNQDSLRTSFIKKNNKLYQKANPFKYYKITLIEERSKSEINKKINALAKKEFNLSQPSLFEFVLFKKSENSFIFFVNIHHIIADGWSLSVFMQQLSTLYKNEKSYENNSLSYLNFSKKQRDEINDYEVSLSYWKAKLKNISFDNSIPIDKDRPKLNYHKGTSIHFHLAENKVNELQKIAKKNEISLFSILFTCFNILLSIYKDNNEIVIGVPHANRNNLETENTIGYFVNILPILTILDNTRTILSCIKTIQYDTREDFKHHDLPFELLINSLKPSRNSLMNPLFQILFTFLNSNKQHLELDNLNSQNIPIRKQTSQFDLGLDFTLKNNKLYGFFEYSTDLFHTSTILTMIKRFKLIIEAFIQNPSTQINQIDYLTKIEKQKIKRFSSGPIKEIPNKTILDYFLSNKEKSKDKIIIKDSKKAYTFSEIDILSNKVSHFIQSKKIPKKSYIGLKTTRSADMIIGIIGILKSGCTYIPISPLYPQNRIDIISQSANISLILSNQEHDKLPNLSSIFGCNIPKDYKHRLPSIDDSAYVIFTSGTTGNPKGAEITHKSLTNRLIWMHNQYDINKKDNFLQKTPFTFDVSVWELMLWIISPSTLYLMPPNAEKSPEKIIETIKNEKITIVHFVPAMLSIFLHYLKNNHKENDVKSLRYIIASGEALSRSDVKIFNTCFNNKICQLINLYGPTEATIDVTHYNCNKHSVNDNVPIGKPIDNLSCYVLNNIKKLQGIGIYGELYLGGVGLAKGYINDKKLTNESFNLVQIFDKKQLLYKTGDIVKLNVNGLLEYKERKDNQIKLNGYRIELSEIQENIKQHQEIKDACVLLKTTDKNTKIIVAYCIKKENSIIDNLDLIHYLKSFIPLYMLPHIIEFIPKFPLTQNGKVDRNALLNTKYFTPQKAKKPSTKLEKILLSIFRHILGNNEINITDNFYSLGGNSIKIIQIAHELQEKGINISISDIMNNDTIESLSDFIVKNKLNIQQLEDGSIKSNTIKDYFELTDLQNMMYDNYSKEIYHFQEHVIFSGQNIDLEKLRNSINFILNNTLLLNTTLDNKDDTIVLSIAESTSNIRIIELEKEISINNQIKLIFDKDQNESFNIIKSPLYRTYLFKESKSKVHLVFTIHHLIFDGWSNITFLNNIVNHYTSNKKINFTLSEQKKFYYNF